jgi:hypothetical protein
VFSELAVDSKTDTDEDEVRDLLLDNVLAACCVFKCLVWGYVAVAIPIIVVFVSFRLRVSLVLISIVVLVLPLVIMYDAIRIVGWLLLAAVVSVYVFDTGFLMEFMFISPRNQIFVDRGQEPTNSKNAMAFSLQFDSGCLIASFISHPAVL